MLAAQQQQAQLHQVVATNHAALAAPRQLGKTQLHPAPQPGQLPPRLGAVDKSGPQDHQIHPGIAAERLQQRFGTRLGRPVGRGCPGLYAAHKYKARDTRGQRRLRQALRGVDVERLIIGQRSALMRDTGEVKNAIDAMQGIAQGRMRKALAQIAAINRLQAGRRLSTKHLSEHLVAVATQRRTQGCADVPTGACNEATHRLSIPDRDRRGMVRPAQTKIKRPRGAARPAVTGHGRCHPRLFSPTGKLRGGERIDFTPDECARDCARP